MKAILVVDVPVGEEEIKQVGFLANINVFPSIASEQHYEFENVEVRPLPKAITDYDVKVTFDYDEDYALGWNDCLKEITQMKYRKKPVVDAIQIGNNLEEVIDFVGNNGEVYVEDAAWKVDKCIPIIYVNIHTLEGTMTASRGDFIIKGVEGELYPCKENIFYETYELAEE